MLSANNILSPAHGGPLATPTQDMVLGVYYLTYGPDGRGAGRRSTRARSSATPARVPDGAGGRARLRGQAGPACRTSRVPRAGAGDHITRRSAGSCSTTASSGRSRRRWARSSTRASTSSSTRRSPSARSQAGVDLVSSYGAPSVALGARRLQGPRVPLREPGGDHDLQERRRHAARQGADPRALRERGRRGPGPVRPGPDHNEERHEKVVDKWTAATDEVAEAMEDEPRPAQPDLHDGQLRARAARSRRSASSPACAA